jgi:hypothetical protein
VKGGKDGKEVGKEKPGLNDPSLGLRIKAD